MTEFSDALATYADAFADAEMPFVTHYAFDAEKRLVRSTLTRGVFWSLCRRAAGVLRAAGVSRGACFAHYFSGNRVEDLAFRVGATMVGAVPVTVNWQADTVERVAYKLELTQSRLMVVDAGVPAATVDALSTQFPNLVVFASETLAGEPELPEEAFCSDLDASATRIIIFTSGTTGRPKGVRLPYRCYDTNRRTFESFLKVAPDDRFAPLIVNPLHHTNSTAITDWALRRGGTHLHLVERYATRYWEIVTELAAGPFDRIVAPSVSRHFDFLENLKTEGRLPVDVDALKQAMRRVDFLIGSAPVGPTTIGRLQAWTGRIPLVRFGSTETCLQVMGTPLDLSETDRLAAFRRGWAHQYRGEAQGGYYIGRPHPPYTACRVVRAIDRDADEYFVDCDAGEPGYLITRGDNVMSEYVNDPEATHAVLHPGGWYTGLRDICFRLRSGADDAWDYFWMSRDSAMLIRGGANTACMQVNAELKTFVIERYGLSGEGFDLAVVGLRLESEHEDTCCVTIALTSSEAQSKRETIAETFLPDAVDAVSKGSRPDRLRFAEVPRNFKGAILMSELKQACLDAFEGT